MCTNKAGNFAVAAIFLGNSASTLALRHLILGSLNPKSKN